MSAHPQSWVSQLYSHVYCDGNDKFSTTTLNYRVTSSEITKHIRWSETSVSQDNATDQWVISRQVPHSTSMTNSVSEQPICKVLCESRGPLSSADHLHFSRPQPDTSLHHETTLYGASASHDVSVYFPAVRPVPNAAWQGISVCNLPKVTTQRYPVETRTRDLLITIYAYAPMLYRVSHHAISETVVLDQLSLSSAHHPCRLPVCHSSHAIDRSMCTRSLICATSAGPLQVGTSRSVLGSLRRARP